MSKTLVVCGYGSGISDAVVRRFAREGFAVAIVGRSADKLEAAAKKLTDEGLHVAPFAADLGDTPAIPDLFERIRKTLGPITVVHYNAYLGAAGDLTTAPVADFEAGFRVSVSGLAAAVQTCLPDLNSQAGSAVLVTGGGFAVYDENVDKMIVQYHAMGLAVAKAAQHKLVGILHQKLGQAGIYVGEVMVMGMVKGTAFDSGSATLEAGAIAEQFWTIYTERRVVSVRCA